MVVVTVTSPLGVFCLTRCKWCATTGRLPSFPAATAARRVMFHAEHVGGAVEDLAA
jgi:hypothetical protein